MTDFDYFRIEDDLAGHLLATTGIPTKTAESASEVLLQSISAGHTAVVLVNDDELNETLADGTAFVTMHVHVYLLSGGPKSARGSDGVAFYKLLQAAAGYQSPDRRFGALKRVGGMRRMVEDGVRMYGVVFSTTASVPGTKDPFASLYQ